MIEVPYSPDMKHNYIHPEYGAATQFGSDVMDGIDPLDWLLNHPKLSGFTHYAARGITKNGFGGKRFDIFAFRA